LSIDDGIFLLSGLGLHLGYAAEKIAESAAWSRPVTARAGRVVKTAEEFVEEAKIASAKLYTGLDLRRDLSKEAAYIPDPGALDTVLSLGFINPENLATFISYLPELDKTQAALCELLVASRLGLKDIPASALEKVTKSLEEVIEGLNSLAFQEGPSPAM